MSGVRAGVVVIALGLAGAGVLALGKQIYEADGPLETDLVVEVPKGSSVSSIADRLERDGVISSAFAFKTAARLRGDAAKLQAGDFEIEAGASLREVLDALAEGRAVEHRVTVAEGLTTTEALALVAASPVLVGEIGAPPAEGALAPDTYFVRRGETRQAVIARMTAAQERILAEAWENRAPDLPVDSPEEALILASIIEKETAIPAERGEVASVLVNRLRKGMRLQMDPTVIYGITEGKGPLGRRLSRKDLRTPTPYNTYTIDGLPPTPIANPGRASIEAALNPADTKYLYFVADGTGGHVFAETLREHERNHREWRVIRAERERAARAQQSP